MRLPSFRDSVLRSDDVLKPLGVQVADLLLSTDEATFDDTVHAFVSLTAIQVRPQGTGAGGGLDLRTQSSGQSDVLALR